MKKYIPVLVAMCLLQVNCARQVTRLDEGTQIDLSGRWNDTDSRLVAEEMVKDGLSRPWISDFLVAKTHNYRRSGYE